jgi:hypothetical protein
VRPLRDVVEGVARAAGISAEALSGESAPALRELLARGLLAVDD